MAQEASAEIPADRAGQIFDDAKVWLSGQYGGRPGFRFREGLFWPKDKFIQRQLNLYVGSRAGLEIYFEQAEGKATGNLIVRERGRLDHNARSIVGAFAGGVACLTFLIMVLAGIYEDWFIRPSRNLPTPHFHGGAFLLGTFLPSILAGLIAFAVTWPLTLLCRPLCSAANRAERIVKSKDLLARLVRNVSSPDEKR